MEILQAHKASQWGRQGGGAPEGEDTPSRLPALWFWEHPGPPRQRSAHPGPPGSGRALPGPEVGADMAVTTQDPAFGFRPVISRPWSGGKSLPLAT